MGFCFECRLGNSEPIKYQHSVDVAGWLCGVGQPVVLRPSGAISFAASGPTSGAPVRSPLGRDAPNSLTRVAPAPGFGRPAPAGFGMGSVGVVGSVGVGKTRYGSSIYSNKNKQLAGLKIRVPMVRFRLRPPFPSF